MDYASARAEDVAHVTGKVVMAYERPYMDVSFAEARQLRSYIRNNQRDIHNRTAEAVAEITDRHGANGLVLAGHSAGAYEVIGIAATRILKPSLLYASDPPAIRNVYAPEFRYAWYSMFHDKQTSGSEVVVAQPRQSPAALKQVRSIAADLVAHAGHGGTSTTLEHLSEVVINQPSLPVVVEFPEHTFTAPTDRLLAIKSRIEGHQDMRSAPAVVDILDGMYHGEIGNYIRFATAVDAAIRTHTAE